METGQGGMESTRDWEKQSKELKAGMTQAGRERQQRLARLEEERKGYGHLSCYLGGRSTRALSHPHSREAPLTAPLVTR